MRTVRTWTCRASAPPLVAFPLLVFWLAHGSVAQAGFISIDVRSETDIRVAFEEERDRAVGITLSGILDCRFLGGEQEVFSGALQFRLTDGPVFVSEPSPDEQVAEYEAGFSSLLAFGADAPRVTGTLHVRNGSYGTPDLVYLALNVRRSPLGIPGTDYQLGRLGIAIHAPEGDLFHSTEVPTGFLVSALDSSSEVRLHATVNSVPLPTSVFLFGSGLIGLVGVKAVMGRGREG